MSVPLLTRTGGSPALPGGGKHPVVDSFGQRRNVLAEAVPAAAVVVGLVVCPSRTKRRETDVNTMSGRVLNGKMLQLPASQRTGRTMHFVSR